MSTTATAEQPKAKLSKATSILFHIAARSHTLAEMFGIELVGLASEPGIRIFNITRAWLEPHPGHANEYTFNADKFAAIHLGHCSEYSNHMVLFILNVWNEGYAKSKGWNFDLFRALNGLDQNNREAVAWWVKHPMWP